LLSTDFIKFKANDGVDDSEIETITINVTNSAPIATDQPTGISCERGGSTFADLDVTDADNELHELEYSMITPPLHGFVALGSDGRFKYKNKGTLSTSEDFFVYEVSDGIYTDQATVTIQITSKPNAIDIEKPCEQGDDTGLIVLKGNSPTNESISYSLITAPTRGSLYYDSGLSNPSGGIPTGSLSQHQVFYENDGVSSADDVFQYQVTDNNGLTSRIADVDINVLAPVVSSFYGTPGNPDDTQTTPRGTSIVEIISGTYNDSFPYPFFPTNFSMIVAGSSSSIFKVDARVTTGTLQTTTMEITLWNTSQRAYDEATTGTTAPVRIKYSGAFNHTSTYANPWGLMTVPPGTYFISVKHYANLNGVANLRFTLT